LAGYWRVDGNAKNAINGTWINSPGKELLNILKKDLKSDYLPIIAEDLGLINKDVELLRDNYELPGMKILQFAFDGNENNPYLPKNIEKENWVVYTGTHDNATTTSWWESLDINIKNHIKDNYKYSNDPSWNLMEIGMSTKANLFISPIQDILSLDDSSRLNTPGTITNNWRWKLNQTLDQIDMNLQKYSDLGNNYGRISN
jgi:4-alpha-glucanotransferase